MKKDVARKLADEAKKCAARLGDPNRKSNYLKEIFKIHEIIPLSEFIGVVIYQKYLPDGTKSKRHVHLFIYKPNIENELYQWIEFAPTDSHLLGFADVAKHKAEAERFNYLKNWNSNQNKGDEE